ncbi:gp241 [Bacillus phage W.Ph.]|uniref:Gp241 n=1 Tax=Bacillus phage W.Ph. TaxID=764595 RepID=G9B1Z2_9CAUD|nr:gp241 [Bacillus phage W.Ph.]ADH03387.1 gp241 [Bacillus phage W.Ph.]
MNLVEVRDLMKDVLDGGRMTKENKAKLQMAFDQVNDKVEKNKYRDELRAKGGEFADYSVASIIKDMTGAMNIFNKYPKAHNSAIDDVKYIDGIRQDLFHSAEFLRKGMSLEEKAEKWDELGRAAERRRVAKELVEATKPIKALMAKYKNHDLAKDMRDLLSQLRAIEKLQNERFYEPRALNEMEEAFKEAKGVRH